MFNEYPFFIALISTSKTEDALSGLKNMISFKLLIQMADSLL